MSTLKDNIKDAMKAAMRAKEKERLGTIRMIQAEIKRIEVDERIDVDDQRILAILDKMCKQRRDSISQFEEAGRDELAAIERAEMAVVQEFLPAALSEAEINELIEQAVVSSGAESPRDMGKVMGISTKKLMGKADGKMISTIVREFLS